MLQMTEISNPLKRPKAYAVYPGMRYIQSSWSKHSRDACFTPVAERERRFGMRLSLCGRLTSYPYLGILMSFSFLCSRCSCPSSWINMLSSLFELDPLFRRTFLLINPCRAFGKIASSGRFPPVEIYTTLARILTEKRCILEEEVLFMQGNILCEVYINISDWMFWCIVSLYISSSCAVCRSKYKRQKLQRHFTPKHVIRDKRS